MNGNFNTMLNVKKSKTMVDARGWLIWDPNDVSADITVTVTQNGVTGTGATFTCTPKDDTWKVDVLAAGGKTYAYGSANGKAEAIVKTKGGPAGGDEYYWESPPLQLK
jgi:hypothetical protein